MLSFPFSIFAQEKVIFEKESVYHHIVVAEYKGIRYMKFGNNIVQSAIDIDNPATLQVEYTKYLPLCLVFKADCQNMLIVGMGGGAVPRLIRDYCPDIKMDVVEIDPVVVYTAQKYFFVEEYPGYEIIVMDGRIFIKKTAKTYDIIILDAYNSDSIPFHMTTVEFLREAKAKLNNDGVIVANLWSSEYDLFLAMLKTYRQVFKYIYKFNVVGKNNIILVACDRKIEPYAIVQKAAELQRIVNFPYDFTEKASHLDERILNTDIVPMLTDDYAPVDWLQHRKK